MSLHAAAQHIAKQGRNGDTMLLHVTADEMAGIRSLAHARGHELPINPKTGLPEANFLSDVWKSFGPTILGAGLAATGVGAPLAALMVGGGYGLAEGSLEKGLMAGLGAFGGAGLGSGLASLGASTAETAAAGSAAAAEAGASNLASGTAAQFGADAGVQTLGNSLTLGGGAAADAAVPSALDAGVGAAAPLEAGFGSAAPGVATTPPPGFGENLSNMGRGIQALAEPGGFKQFSAATEAAAGVKPTTAGMAAAAPYLMATPEAQYQDPGKIRPYSYNTRTGGFTPMGEVSAADWAGSGRKLYDVQGYAGGGLTALIGAGARSLYDEYEEANRRTPITGQHRHYAVRDGRLVSTGSTEYSYAAGGTAEGTAGGRFLRGSGDGVSDSIPAQIDGRQPAALADGEFVIPARIVSELGNGSSEAGARQLYAMMDRVQASRRKSAAPGKFADDTKAAKHLPA